MHRERERLHRTDKDTVLAERAGSSVDGQAGVQQAEGIARADGHARAAVVAQGVVHHKKTARLVGDN